MSTSQSDVPLLKRLLYRGDFGDDRPTLTPKGVAPISIIEHVCSTHRSTPWLSFTWSFNVAFWFAIRRHRVGEVVWISVLDPDSIDLWGIADSTLAPNGGRRSSPCDIARALRYSTWAEEVFAMHCPAHAVVLQIPYEIQAPDLDWARYCRNRPLPKATMHALGQAIATARVVASVRG